MVYEVIYTTEKFEELESYVKNVFKINLKNKKITHGKTTGDFLFYIIKNVNMASTKRNMSGIKRQIKPTTTGTKTTVRTT